METKYDMWDDDLDEEWIELRASAAANVYVEECGTVDDLDVLVMFEDGLDADGLSDSEEGFIRGYAAL